MPLNISLGMPLTLLLRERGQLVRRRSVSDAKLLTNIFLKKILKVLQGTPLKNTSELKQRRKHYTEP